mgnify:CR=1 FL=1
MRPVACVALLLAWAVPAAGAEVVDRVLAVVGSQVILLSDYRAARAFALLPADLPATTPDEALEALVDRELMLGEVQRFAVAEPDRAAVDRRLAQIRASFSPPAAFGRALALSAMTEDRLRIEVARSLQIDAYVEQRFAAPGQPGAAELQRYYAGHPAEFTRNGRLLPLPEVRAQVQARLAAARKRDLVVQWLDRLRRGTHIEIDPGAMAAMAAIK